jgi:porphyrinogen peroxidase
MTPVQPGVLAPVPPLARYLTFRLGPRYALRRTLLALSEIADGDQCVVGIGEPLLRALGAEIAGMRPFPSAVGDGFVVPATPAALWCWLRGNDRGELVHRHRAIQHALAPAFVPETVIDAFRHGIGRDLTGYEDGTENPRGRKAVAAAVVRGMGVYKHFYYRYQKEFPAHTPLFYLWY